MESRANQIAASVFRRCAAFSWLSRELLKPPRWEQGVNMADTFHQQDHEHDAIPVFLIIILKGKVYQFWKFYKKEIWCNAFTERNSPFWKVLSIFRVKESLWPDQDMLKSLSEDLNYAMKRTKLPFLASFYSFFFFFLFSSLHLSLPPPSFAMFSLSLHLSFLSQPFFSSDILKQTVMLIISNVIFWEFCSLVLLLGLSNESFLMAHLQYVGWV